MTRPRRRSTAWLAGGDLVDVVRATGLRDWWTEDEIVRAQAKITSASARKRPPDWLCFLERVTQWVDATPLPSPFAEARMPSWAKGFLLARVSRVPSSARLEWAQPRRPCDEAAPDAPPRATMGTCGLKRKRELGERGPDAPAPPASTGHAGLRSRGTASDGPVACDTPGARLRVKGKSPSYSPVSGEESDATGYSGQEDDDDGTCLCPGWAIKHRPPHLVYTSAYRGDDCTGAFWAGASPGEGVAMRVVVGLADTAVDPLTEDDEGTAPSSGVSSSRYEAPARRGLDAVGLCPRADPGDAEQTSLPSAPLGRHPRRPPGTPTGPRETAKYGFCALRIGEAIHLGPTDARGGDLGRLRHAAAVAERVARIDELVAGVRAEYQALQAERFALVGAYTPGGPTGTPPPSPPRSARRSRTPSSPSSGSDGALPSSDGGGTSHGTSHTTTSRIFARIRGDPGASIGEGHDTPPPAYGTDDEGAWSMSPGSRVGDASGAGRSRGPVVGSSHEVPSRWQGPDTPEGKICGCRPGVPFTPPYVICRCCGGPGELPHTPPSPCDPSGPPAGLERDSLHPPAQTGGRDGTLLHSLHRVGQDGCYCEVLCLCAIRARADGRLSLAGPGGTARTEFETTPDRRRPHAPTVAPRPARRLPWVGRETYGAVIAPYVHLDPGNFYEALHSMRRVCSCNPDWVRYYHEDMGWGPFVDRPCACGCPWRHGKYRPEWPPGVFDHVGPEYEPRVCPMDALRAEGYPDDPEIVHNPWEVGLFFGAPQLRTNQSRTLFPRTARESIMSPLGPRPRPRVSSTATRSPRGFATVGRICPV